MSSFAYCIAFSPVLVSLESLSANLRIFSWGMIFYTVLGFGQNWTSNFVCRVFSACIFFIDLEICDAIYKLGKIAYGNNS